MKEIIAITALVIGVVVLSWFITIGAVSWDKSQTRVSCQNFGSVANRETKYVEYTYWSYDCITPTKDGKWISTGLLREI